MKSTNSRRPARSSAYLRDYYWLKRLRSAQLRHQNNILRYDSGHRFSVLVIQPYGRGCHSNQTSMQYCADGGCTICRGAKASLARRFPGAEVRDVIVPLRMRPNGQCLLDLEMPQIGAAAHGEPTAPAKA